LPMTSSSNNAQSSMMSSIFSNTDPSSTSESNNNTTAPVRGPEPQETGFPSSGGRTLGSASSRTNSADARVARLAALERKAADAGNNP